MIYKVRPSSNTTIRAALNNPSAPSFTPAVAIVSGATGHPQRFVDTAPAAGDDELLRRRRVNYTPSNFVVGTSAGQANFTTAPTVSLTCASTITFNSTTNTWTSYCAGQTQPTPGDEDAEWWYLISWCLPFKSLTVGSSTTIVLTGTRPVVFAVESSRDDPGTDRRLSGFGDRGRRRQLLVRGTSAGGDGAG